MLHVVLYTVISWLKDKLRNNNIGTWWLSTCL